jgi:hypothetical protein
MTREEAAWRIPSSVSTIKRIEYRQQTPTPELEAAMAKAYNAPWVADPTVPDDYKPLQRAQALLNYVNEREDVEALMPRARRILADGKIDRTEAEDFRAIAREIKEECAAARDLLYAQ